MMMMMITMHQFIQVISYLILCFSLLMSSGTEANQQTSPHDLKTQETFDTFGGALGPLRAHLDPVRILRSSDNGPITSYDDFHKYGGISKKLLGSLDHGTDGYKNYYGDSEHLDQGLNKYSGQYRRDKYGGKSGNHKDYHDTHVYTRNRGYGYEKHYMYDKEYSTGKSIGTNNGHHSYYGDHDHGAKLSIDAHKNYESKKFGGKSSHSEHSNEVPIITDNDYSSLVDGDFGNDNLLKHKKEIHHLKKHLDHHHHHHHNHHLPSPITYAKVQGYVPVIENYGGIVPSTRLSSPTYGTTIIESSDPHYYPQTAFIPSQHLQDEAVYLSSASNDQKIHNKNDRNLDTEGESINTLNPGTTTTTDNNKVINTAPLISTRLPSVTGSQPRLTVAESFARIQSAVHATPPVISTHHYRQ